MRQTKRVLWEEAAPLVRAMVTRRLGTGATGARAMARLSHITPDTEVVLVYQVRGGRAPFDGDSPNPSYADLVDCLEPGDPGYNDA